MPLRPLLLALSFLLITSVSIAQNFSKQTVLDDLDYLNQSLRQTHFDLFAYTSEAVFQENFQKIKSSVIEDSMSLKATINLFQKVISKVNMGHATIDFPGTAYRAYNAQGGTLFPLELAFEADQVLVRRNFSKQEDLQIGSPVLAIDGVPIKEVLQAIYPYLSAENVYFKNAKLEYFSFPRMYWQVFGQKDTFEVTIKMPEGIKTYTVQAISVYEDYESKRIDIINPDRMLKYYDQTAYLKPGAFGGAEQPFKDFIDSAFADINKQQVDQLIVDLRNHGGGDNAFSDYLTSYFATKSFKWNSQYAFKSSEILKNHTRAHSDTTRTFFQSILNHPNGTTYTYDFEAYPAQETIKRFKGKVYVLINRHSYSMSAVAAATIQDYEFGTIVGEPSGDWPSLHASIFQYALPKTGIQVKVPKGYMIRPNGSEAHQGVIPDLFIQDHLVDEKDEILETLLRKIKTQ